MDSLIPQGVLALLTFAGKIRRTYSVFQAVIILLERFDRHPKAINISNTGFSAIAGTQTK